MTSPTAVAYVFHGQDEPSLKEALADFCAKAGGPDPGMAVLNTTKLDGVTVELGEIQMAANSLPFLAERRLVIVENITDSAAGRTLLDAIGDLVAGLPDWSRLVFVETGLGESGQDSEPLRKRKTARRAALKKLINVIEADPRGKVYSFEPPQDSRKWLARRAALHGAEIEPQAAQRLAERTGDDLTLADTELAKLAAYANGERPISAADVELLTAFTPEANIFHMVDALGQRNGREALNLLRQLLESGDEPLRIFGMIVRQYRLLIQMREHLDSGGTVNNAAQALEIKDFVAKKLAAQANRYSMEQLERIYRRLLETDLAMKGGMDEREALGRAVDRLDPALAIEELVVRLSARG